MQYKFALKVRLRYLLKAHYRRGHHVHSPFVYSMLNNTLFETLPYYSFRKIEALRARLSKDKTKITLAGGGTGGMKETSVGRELRRSGKNVRHARLLQRLCASNNAKTIVELGTNLGISTMYLASNDSKSQVFTYEAEPALISVAQGNFDKLRYGNIQIIKGNIDDTLPRTIDEVGDIDLMFIDANHTHDATMRYYNIAKRRFTNNTILVMDDIHWSEGMEKAWDEIRGGEDVRLSIDIFSMGILWFRSELPKQHYTVAF